MDKTLSAFNYYGGKARMAPHICDLLDYDTTDIYIEPFGGGARTLLNKPRHKVEIYNDASAGLCAFMGIIGDPERYMELINRLYQTEYSPEEFYRALILRNRIEDNYIDEFKRQAVSYLKLLQSKYDNLALLELRSFIVENKIRDAQRLYGDIISSSHFTVDELQTLEALKGQLDSLLSSYTVLFRRAYRENLLDEIEAYREMKLQSISDEINKSTDIKQVMRLERRRQKISEMSPMTFHFSLNSTEHKKVKRNSIKKAHENVYEKADNLREDGYTEKANGKSVTVEIDDMDLAVATYVIYSQSRDGMGKDWSKSKYKSTDDYHRQLSRLYDVAERMRGVQINQVGALGFLLTSADIQPYQHSFLDQENVCFYLDPSYLDPKKEERNLGKAAYKFSSDYEAHKLLLQRICRAKAKIIISNYDSPLYNQYLTPANGWHKMEFQTRTSVGSMKDNQRTEILWWNY